MDPKLFYEKYLCVCIFVYVCIWICHVGKCLQKTEKCIESPGTGLTNSCEPPDMCAQN